MYLTDFHYDLPEELIARYPLAERSASRLLCLDRKTGCVTHRRFTDLVELLQPEDLLICNNSRVIPARLFGHKATGGHVEVLVERILDTRRVLAQVKASKTPKPKSILLLSNNVSFEIIQRHGDLFELRCEDDRPMLEVIEAIGQVPIPPYFARPAESLDTERYQTIYAEPKGSVAAPTAGLHFDEALFSRLREKNIAISYVTLHVGAGTFASVRVQNIAEHRMHSEYVEVPPVLCEQIRQTKARRGRIVAVGTTTARSLETASRSGEIQPFTGETDIFIYPGFQFHCIDTLITNFHLPCSTLLMLTCAWGGHEAVMQAYQTAVKEQYRFFSYGDAMWVG
jgi:S-adenosylmethionine:tRNA ribosyltransferase-isomerase